MRIIHLASATAISYLTITSLSAQQRPLRTSGVIVGESELEDPSALYQDNDYAIQVVYSHIDSPKGYVYVNFYLSGSNLFLWNSTFKISWNPKAVRFKSISQDKKKLRENARLNDPRAGLKIMTRYDEGESFAYVFVDPVLMGKKTWMDGEYYIGTLKLRVIDKHKVDGLSFEPVITHLFSKDGTDVSSFTTYDLQEYENNY